jgi:uncharacterized protein YcfJ
LSHCPIPSEARGATLGGAGGGYAGSMFGKGQGKLLATAGGALLGAGAGGYLGSFFDQTNRNSGSIQQIYQQRRIGYDGVGVYRWPVTPDYMQRGYQIPLNCRVQNN